jgi:hypothetical protein
MIAEFIRTLLTLFVFSLPLLIRSLDGHGTYMKACRSASPRGAVLVLGWWKGVGVAHAGDGALLLGWLGPACLVFPWLPSSSVFVLGEGLTDKHNNHWMIGRCPDRRMGSGVKE